MQAEMHECMDAWMHGCSDAGIFGPGRDFRFTGGFMCVGGESGRVGEKRSTNLRTSDFSGKSGSSELPSVRLAGRELGQ